MTAAGVVFGPCVDDVVRLILEEGLTEVVLVGHGYSGLVISSAANQVPERISQLVHLDAMVPEDGETAADVQPITQALIDLAAKSGSCGFLRCWRCRRPGMITMPVELVNLLLKLG